MNAFAHVLRLLVAAQHRLLLAQNALARAQVKVKHAPRRNERLIRKAQMRGVKFRIGATRGVISGFGKRDAIRIGEQVATRQRGHAQVWQPVFALQHGQVRSENIHRGQHHARAIRYHFLPTIALRRIDRRLHQPKRAAKRVGPNIKNSAARIG